eukprot:g50787.t1
MLFLAHTRIFLCREINGLVLSLLIAAVSSILNPLKAKIWRKRNFLGSQGSRFETWQLACINGKHPTGVKKATKWRFFHANLRVASRVVERAGRLAAVGARLVCVGTVSGRGLARVMSGAAASSKNHDYLFKLIIIGDTGTGKSCLLRYFLEKTFVRNTTHTIGVEFGSKVVEVGKHKVKLQIWDTAGQERYRSVTKSYYRGAIGCLVVYDITSRESYNHLLPWLNDAKSLARSDLAAVIVGNKCDLKDDRDVTVLEASRLAQENDLLFMEASARSGEYVDEIFIKLTRTILSKIESGDIDGRSLSGNDGPSKLNDEDASSCSC